MEDNKIVKIDVEKINRIEVINHAKNKLPIGRLYVLYQNKGDFKNIELSIQDDGQTLKIFVG